MDQTSTKSVGKPRATSPPAGRQASVATRNRLSRGVVDLISREMDETDDLHQQRVRALDVFARKRLPRCNGELVHIDFDKVNYRPEPSRRVASMDELPAAVKEAVARLGLMDDTGRSTARVTSVGVTRQLSDEVLERLRARGVIFTDLHTAWRDHRELVARYFGSIVHASDDKFAALNAAVWSGGTFVYVPRGVTVDVPLHPDMRPNAAGQTPFERTLIVCEEDTRLSFIEGCASPIYSNDSLRACVAEVVVKRGARCRFTTLQNWSRNVQDTATKRAEVHGGGSMVWIDCNLGSHISWKCPELDLHEADAQGEIVAISVAGDGQLLHVGGKAVHHAPHTMSRLRAFSVSHGGGQTTHRGHLKLHDGCAESTARFDSDALLIHEGSRNDTFPLIEMDEKHASVGHESRISRVNEEQLFYLRSRGMGETEALRAMVGGFLETSLKELPVEYAVEVRRLVESELENHAS